MKKEKETMMYDSLEAATFVTNISGWIDKDGRFFGNNKDSEHMARYSSCTHMRCECGELMTKGWTKCEKCRSISDIEKYNKLTFKEWNGKDIVYSELVNKYFNDSDEIEYYCADEEIDPKDLRLLLCYPNEFREIESDYWEDVLPEESEGELPKKLQEALIVFNEVIKSLSPASYSPSKTRTTYLRSV